MYRPPIIAILGHVDHGKTTLLDYIRKTNITGGEAGGITQRIGGYEVATGIKGYHTDKITFIDTPGHEVFSKLRARGTTLADIAILIIDAKDGVKPQTVESIAHIKAAGIPFIVALNKIDLPEANPEKIKNELLKHDVLVEGKGGNTPVLPISAKTGKGVHELLEAILLIASEHNLSYEKSNPLQVFVVETKKDKRGVVVSCIIKDGVLSVGDSIYNGAKAIKIRSLIDDHGKNISKVEPSAAFELLGFSQMPEVGALLTDSPKEARKKDETPISKPDLEALLKSQEESKKKLAVIIKTDTQGSAEAISASLAGRDEIEVLSIGVGNVANSDIFLAKTSGKGAIIVGFNVKVDADVKDLAKQEKIIIKTYQIIYELLDELTEVSTLLREKEEREKSLKGEARVLANFVINGETVFGVRMTKGKAGGGDNVEVYREGKLIGKAKLTSLRIRAKAVAEVKKDQEAGMGFTPALDIMANDMVKFVL